MAKVPVNARDFTAVVPDGPVNRHAQVVLYLDTDTGALSGEPAIEVARHEALGPTGNLPVEQLVGSGAASAAELDALREQVKQLTAKLAERDNTEGSD